jgi:hypothetical protein
MILMDFVVEINLFYFIILLIICLAVQLELVLITKRIPYPNLRHHFRVSKDFVVLSHEQTAGRDVR